MTDMAPWIADLIASVETALTAQQLDPSDVAYVTKRRIAYELRWPVRRQMEAHLDAANGSDATIETMKAEFAEIKAHPFFAKP
ncbi:conserved hypothetical protein [Magnetospirillum molischianum DSM 120]|uniref:Uncharacterized protein n=2 Tax=Magnetospirillum molischianum TaxID=1083 RepID=H8FUC5_MAGML|nr:conserved hypothetical protein [Magnetospirillum molischianum DSM 120]